MRHAPLLTALSLTLAASCAGRDTGPIGADVDNGLVEASIPAVGPDGIATLGDPPPPPPPPRVTLAPAPAAIDAFAADLHKQLVAADPAANLVYSPASVEIALGMTLAGAAGPTHAAMASTLHLDGVDHADLGAPQRAWSAAPADAPDELAVANRLWVQRGLRLGEGFLATTRDHYGATTGEVDFSSGHASEPINAWVAAQTRDRIPDLVPESALKPTTRLVLTNAVYFKGSWVAGFDPAATATEPFWRLDGASVDAPLMFRSGATTWARHDGFQLVALPYEGGRVEMVILVPDARDGLPALEARLDEAALASWRATAREVPRVDLHLPKMTLTGSFSLSTPLKAMGMELAFSDGADFSAMSPDLALKIDEVIHRAFVAVDEVGTEAAAATAVIMVTRTSAAQPPPPPVVRADHPFLFTLRDVHSGATLFVARVVDPTG